MLGIVIKVMAKESQLISHNYKTILPLSKEPFLFLSSPSHDDTLHWKTAEAILLILLSLRDGLRLWGSRSR